MIGLNGLLGIGITISCAVSRESKETSNIKFILIAGLHIFKSDTEFSNPHTNSCLNNSFNEDKEESVVYINI